MSFLVIGVKKEQSYGLITHKKQQPFVAQKKIDTLQLLSDLPEYKQQILDLGKQFR